MSRLLASVLAILVAAAVGVPAVGAQSAPTPHDILATYLSAVPDVTSGATTTYDDSQMPVASIVQLNPNTYDSKGLAGLQLVMIKGTSADAANAGFTAMVGNLKDQGVALEPNPVAAFGSRPNVVGSKPMTLTNGASATQIIFLLQSTDTVLEVIATGGSDADPQQVAQFVGTTAGGMLKLVDPSF